MEIDVKNIRLVILLVIFIIMCVLFAHSYGSAYSLKTEDAEVVYDTEESSAMESSSGNGSYSNHTEESFADNGTYSKHAKESSAGYDSNSNHTEESFAEDGSYADHTEAEKDEDIVLYAKFSGGVKPYEYKYYERLPGEKWKAICEYTDEQNISVKFPSEYDRVRYRIEARDASGKILHKDVSVISKTMREFSDCGTCLNYSFRYVGTPVTVYAKFRGGKTPYRYQYYYKSGNGQWSAAGGVTDSGYKVIDLSSEGEYTIRVTATDADGTKITKDMNVKCSYYMPVRNICQYSEPSLPTGCEVTALASYLGYYGFDVSKNVIADKYLPKGKLFNSNGKMYGPDPLTIFVGSPESVNSFGCYGKCIEITANRYLQSVNSHQKAKDISGKEFSELLSYIMRGKPVIVWTTMGLSQTVLTSSWQTTYGKTITWKGNEHCVVLAGYNPDRKVVYVADPMKDTASLTEYSYDLFRQRYDEQGKNAVIIE